MSTGNDIEQSAQLQVVRSAVSQYHLALSQQMDCGLAQHIALSAIELALGFKAKYTYQCAYGHRSESIRTEDDSDRPEICLHLDPKEHPMVAGICGLPAVRGTPDAQPLLDKINAAEAEELAAQRLSDEPMQRGADISPYTPGPWKDCGQGFITGIENGIEVDLCCVEPRILEGCSEANARLIAAAPELLEALQAAVACGMVTKSSVLDGGASKYSRQVEVADMIRAAIAKATGAAP